MDMDRAVLNMGKYPLYRGPMVANEIGLVIAVLEFTIARSRRSAQPVRSPVVVRAAIVSPCRQSLQTTSVAPSMVESDVIPR